ncbi:hypothetical protein Cgig2_016994 [Carnegiea gigantea]|uniref:Endonuclease/exonuclease/phosphatase domain-containing protein n=1 Tax=Carnegiea gigantea TaxID=171969 RepID=A0A9Q1KIN5_9CARY|nr:hypothetical protein Cgig2_016994 [Carnegiea gigantea]
MTRPGPQDPALRIPSRMNTNLLTKGGRETVSVHACKLMVWNIQEAGSSKTINILKEHIRLHMPSIVAIIKTHIYRTRAQTVCDKIGFGGNFRVEARGFQGGIWIFCKLEDVEVDIIHAHEHYVTMEIKQRRHLKWVCTVVYASPHVQMREILWAELQQFASQCTHLWLIAGDFNETINLKERNHGGPDMLTRCTRFKH